MHVITRLIVGGAQLTALGLCERLSDRFDLLLVTGTETGSEGSLRGRAADVVPLHDFPELVRGIDPRRDARAVWRLRSLLHELDADIVHTHSSKAGIVGRAAARGLRARVVHTIHGWGHTPSDRPARRHALVAVERIAARWSDALVAVSDDVRLEGIRRRIGRPSQYVVIPELVDVEPRDPDFARARSRARGALGVDGAAGPVVGWVGRFVPQKDPEMLGRVVGRVLQELPSAQAVLVGDGPLRRDVEQVLQRVGVAGRACFTGLRPDARDLYAAMDVVLHPSRWEGQPRVVQEALAERVPVIATRVAGVADLVVDGENGFVVTPGDAEAMARRAVAMLRGGALQAPLAATALESLRRTAGADRCVDAHAALYERLLSESA